MYTQHAFGTTEFDVVVGTNHCGVNDSKQTVEWHIDLTFEDDGLDEHGFLLDNTAFKAYFTAMSTVPVSISCERLACKICEDIIRMSGDRCKNVAVFLSPFPGATVCHRNDDGRIVSEKRPHMVTGGKRLGGYE